MPSCFFCEHSALQCQVWETYLFLNGGDVKNAAKKEKLTPERYQQTFTWFKKDDRLGGSRDEERRFLRAKQNDRHEEATKKQYKEILKTSGWYRDIRGGLWVALLLT